MAAKYPLRHLLIFTNIKGKFTAESEYIARVDNRRCVAGTILLSAEVE